MKAISFLYFWLATIFLGMGLDRAWAETLTYPQLVSRLTDLEQLAVLPLDGEKAGLASSYDRSSIYDVANDKYVNWGANNDGVGLVRQEGDQSVLAEIDGPGCLWRIWTARAEQGHVKIYLDGAASPVVDLPFRSYFDGKTPPFDRPNLVNPGRQAANGLNNYTPIPFQKSCRIVADPGWGNYYQFTYSRFPAGTVVPTFHMNLSPEEAAALDSADRLLGRCGENPAGARPEEKTERKTVQAPAGAIAEVATLPGPEAVTALRVRLTLPQDAEAQRILLRQLAIQITWDGDARPAVWSPLGDFFGYVGGAQKFQSFPVGLTEDGFFYSYWYMPFASRARIEVVNDGPSPVSMEWEVSHAPLDRPLAGLGRFHAKWHRDAFLVERPDRFPDWPLLVTRGRGRYVGTHLHGWTACPGWWGEGDDKFFVDDEKFPSLFGTGSEDYFGYAWSSPGLFSRPYHNQVLNEDNTGHFDDNRWHIPDSIPFQKSFEGCLEKYLPNKRPTLYAAEAYWYLSPDGTDAYDSVPVADRIGYWHDPSLPIASGAMEGEWYRAVDPLPAEKPTVESLAAPGLGWSRNTQLSWNPRGPGEHLALRSPPWIGSNRCGNLGGKFRILARFTKEPAAGQFTLTLDGKALGGAIDLYDTTRNAPGPVDLGIVDLARTDHVLGIDVAGKNAASGGYAFGLDYLVFEPIP